MHMNQLDAAEQALAEEGRAIRAAFRPGSEQWMDYQNNIAVLRAVQGRLRESLVAMQAQKPYMDMSSGAHLDDFLGFQVNELGMRSMLGDDAGLETAQTALLGRIDQINTRDNDLSYQLLSNMASSYDNAGEILRALSSRERLLARAQSAAHPNPGRVWRARASLLLAQAAAFGADRSAVENEARRLLEEVGVPTAGKGNRASAVWATITRIGLLYDDERLASEALARLHADVDASGDRFLKELEPRVEGDLARLQGDLPLSRRLLVQHLHLFDGYPDKALARIWSSTLDLAYTEVLMGDMHAAETLGLAAGRRPPHTREDAPLAAFAAYLAVRLQYGSDSQPPVQAALAALAHAQHRALDDPRAGRVSRGILFLG
jgi:hypothetical protein